jgi:hypothetical protein
VRFRYFRLFRHLSSLLIQAETGFTEQRVVGCHYSKSAFDAEENLAMMIIFPRHYSHRINSVRRTTGD